MNRTRSRILIGILLCLPIWGPPPAQAGVLDGLLAPKYKEFRDLVDAGRKEAALALLAREADYFEKLEGGKLAFVEGFRQTYLLDQLTALVSADRDVEALALIGNQMPRLGALSGERSARYQALQSAWDARRADRLQHLLVQLDEADATPSPMRRWISLKALLPGAQSDSRAVSPSITLEKSEPVRVLLEAKTQSISSKLQTEAGEAISLYGWFTLPAFTEVYPIKPDMAALMGHDAALPGLIEEASTAKIKRFVQMYRSAMPSPLQQQVAVSYARRLVSERGAYTYLDKRALFEQAKKDHLDVGEGRVLLVARPVSEAFRRQVTLQAPKAVEIAELSPGQTPGSFLATPQAKERDLIVFLYFQEPRTERSEKSRQTLSSRFQSGSRTVNNPRYAEAVEAVSRAERALAAQQMQARNTRSDVSGGLGAAIALLSAVSDAAARSALDEARQTLVNTPRTIQERVLMPYTYVRTVHNVWQGYGVKFAIYDPASGDTYVDEVKVGVGRDFNLVEGVHANDPDAATLQRGTVDAQTLEKFLNTPLTTAYDSVWRMVFDKYRKAKSGAAS